MWFTLVSHRRAAQGWGVKDHLPPSLKDVARRSGFSAATVSYALRGDTRIPATTRAAVIRAAKELGYRHNRRVASVMSFIRQSRSRRYGERIAFVWVHTSPNEVERDTYLRNLYAGARQRAAVLGFGVDAFWTSAPGMNEERLQRIILARGIRGVILSPVKTDEVSVTLQWDWSAFAAAVIGNTSWTPELHHSGHHHYLAVRMALQELRGMGLERPAALLEPKSHLRTKHAWQGSFLTHHPRAPRAARWIRIHDPDQAEASVRWLEELDADTLIVSELSLLNTPGLWDVVHRRHLAVITLYWNAQVPPGIGGIDQCDDRVAAHAVDLVAAQLNSNELGAPEFPRMMLFPGRWVAPVPPPGALR